MCDTIRTWLQEQREAHEDTPTWEQYINETFGAKSRSMQKKINGCRFLYFLVLKYPCTVYLGLTEKLDSLLQNAHKYVPPWHVSLTLIHFFCRLYQFLQKSPKDAEQWKHPVKVQWVVEISGQQHYSFISHYEVHEDQGSIAKSKRKLA